MGMNLSDAILIWDTFEIAKDELASRLENPSVEDTGLTAEQIEESIWEDHDLYRIRWDDYQDLLSDILDEESFEGGWWFHESSTPYIHRQYFVRLRDAGEFGEKFTLSLNDWTLRMWRDETDKSLRFSVSDHDGTSWHKITPVPWEPGDFEDALTSFMEALRYHAVGFKSGSTQDYDSNENQFIYHCETFWNSLGAWDYPDVIRGIRARQYITQTVSGKSRINAIKEMWEYIENNIDMMIRYSCAWHWQKKVIRAIDEYVPGLLKYQGILYEEEVSL